MVKHQERLDAIFSALSDATRRRILERLARGEMTVGEIAAGFSMSQPAISKHVKILEESGLLAREIDGRVHRCKIVPKAAHSAIDWIEKQERYWNATIDNLEAYLESTTTTTGKKTT